MQKRICLLFCTFFILISMTACGDEASAAKSAYLKILQSEKTAIETASTVSSEGQIAIIDLDNDKIPELVYIKDNTEPSAPTRYALCVWDYEDDVAVQTFIVHDFFKQVGSGANFTVISASDGSIYVYEKWRGEESGERYTKFERIAGSFVSADNFQVKRSPSADYAGVVENYFQNGEEITADQFSELTKKCTGIVLLTSFSSSEDYWDLSIISMDYATAETTMS